MPLPNARAQWRMCDCLCEAGLVFTSNGFQPGSIGYTALTAVTVAIITSTTAAFATLLAFEVYRSLKFAALHEAARQVEVENAEQALLNRAKRRPTRLSITGLAAHIAERRDSRSRRRSSVLGQQSVVNPLLGTAWVAEPAVEGGAH